MVLGGGHDCEALRRVAGAWVGHRWSPVRQLEGSEATPSHPALIRAPLPRLSPPSSFKGQTAREAAWNVAVRVAPFLNWAHTYDVKRQLLPDIAAGVAVTCLIIPQGLSYAGVAG